MPTKPVIVKGQNIVYATTGKLYDEELRGSKTPVYTAKENQYRNDRLNELQLAYMVREQTHMELNDMTYSEYYLINRQQDMAYNPPKKNPTDSRIVSGIIHEKDNTILSILMDMNFQPKVRIFDEDNTEMLDAGTILTARIKKSLIEDNFKQKQEGMFRTNIAQGNVFVEEKPYFKKYIAKKIPTNKTEDPTKLKWKTIIEEEDVGCTSILLPNTAIFVPNLLESDLKKQPYLFVVMHLPTTQVAQIYKDFPRWDTVPKSPTRTIPVNIDGVWGDYFLQQPANDYMEVIIYQSEMRNDTNVYLNGVQMYDVGEDASGFPLTYFSPSGEYTIVKGDNEPIPFFFYGRSVPSKNQVKEEELNELMRLMFRMLRQKVAPPVGNNSDKVLQANIWDPAVITPDIRKEDLSILTPNAGIGPAEFSFAQMLSASIAESSVSTSIEGGNQAPNITATQYVDQKKENLKKLGLSIDQTINFLKRIYWLRLMHEAQYITKKKKKYSSDDDKLIEAYSDFVVDDSIDGTRGKVKVRFMDDLSGMSPEGIYNEEESASEPTRILVTNPSYIKKLIDNMKDKIYIDVVAEPDGQNQSLLAVLFNLLTQYSNLRGGDSSSINFEYLEKIIGQNSGFEADKLFIKKPPMPNMPMGVDPATGLPQMNPSNGPTGGAGKASQPVIPQLSPQHVEPAVATRNVKKNLTGVK